MHCENWNQKEKRYRVKGWGDRSSVQGSGKCGQVERPLFLVKDISTSRFSFFPKLIFLFFFLPFAAAVDFEGGSYVTQIDLELTV